MPANPLKGLYEMRRRELAAQSLLEEGLSRREVLRRGAVAGAGVMVGPTLLAACGDDDDDKGSGGGGGSSDEINLLSWEGYQADAWLKEFTKKSGIKVNVTNVGSPAEMFAKVKASPGQFDVIYNTAGWFDQYVQSGLIIPIDESKVPNVKEISDAFPWRDATSVKGTNYGILYTWGAQPLGWNAAEVPGDYDISQYVGRRGHPGRLEHLLGRAVQGEGDDLRRSHLGRADDPAGDRHQEPLQAQRRRTSRSSARASSSSAPGEEAHERVRRPDEHVRHGRGDHRLREP